MSKPHPYHALLYIEDPFLPGLLGVAAAEDSSGLLAGGAERAVRGRADLSIATRARPAQIAGWEQPARRILSVLASLAAVRYGVPRVKRLAEVAVRPAVRRRARAASTRDVAHPEAPAIIVAAPGNVDVEAQRALHVAHDEI